MITLLVIILICLAGSALGCTLGCKRSIRLVPVTIMGIVFILYVFSLFRLLLIGVYLVTVLCLLIYILFAVQVIRGRKWQDTTFRRFLLSCIPVFVACFIISFSMKGMVLHFRDEFSHWGAVVKAMFYLDDLGTNPASGCVFASYPPAMALWQYYIEKLNLLIHPGNDFVEWWLYFAYQIFTVTLYIPLIADGRKKRFEAFTLSFLLLTVPILFFPDIYRSLYIDPFIAVAGASAFSYILLVEDKDPVYDIYVTLSCFTLVLAKDVGIVFAVIAAVVYAVDRISLYRKDIKRCLPAAIPLIAVLFAKKSWAFEISRRGVNAVFSSKIDLGEYLHMLIYHDGTDWRQEVVDNTLAAFSSRIESEVWAIPYYAIFLMLFAMSLVCLVLLCRNKVLHPAKAIVIGTIPAVLVLGYAFFIGAMYEYRFSYDEAMDHAGYSRYIFVVFVFYIIVLAMLAEKSLMQPKRRPMVLAAVCYLFILLASRDVIPSYIFRYDVIQAGLYRSEFKDLSRRVRDFCPDESMVYVVSRESARGDVDMVIQFDRRPVPVDLTVGSYSLGPKLNDSDKHSRDITPKEWLDELKAMDVDYVAIHILGDDFKDHYGSVFEDTSDLEDDAVFYFDREKDLLTRCRYE